MKEISFALILPVLGRNPSHKAVFIVGPALLLLNENLSLKFLFGEEDCGFQFC